MPDVLTEGLWIQHPDGTTSGVKIPDRTCVRSSYIKQLAIILITQN